MALYQLGSVSGGILAHLVITIRQCGGGDIDEVRWRVTSSENKVHCTYFGQAQCSQRILQNEVS